MGDFLLCVCVMLHIVLQMALRSPWRLLTYHRDVVGGFGFLVCSGRLEEGVWVSVGKSLPNL